jgi:hypothetical protein
MNDELAYQYEAPLPVGSIRTKLPTPNDRFGYLSARALNVWPDINGNNATFLDDVLAAFYNNPATSDDRFAGKIVNLNHSIGKGNVVVGTIYSDRYIPGVGVDTINRIDKRLLASFELDIDEFAGAGQYAKQSIEIMPDHSKSQFIVMKNEGSKRLEDQDIYSAQEAASRGIRRTSVVDPFGSYYHEGKYRVVEAVHPKVMCGVAMLPNPADRNSIVYDLAASLEDDFPYFSDYDNVEPYCIDASDMNELEDPAFAVVDGDTRDYPLYASHAEHASDTPHPGLIKTAVDALRNPQHGYSSDTHAVAVQRITKAHTQLQSKEKQMADETAALKDEVASLKGTIATKTDEIASLTNQKTDLSTQLNAVKDENASLVAKNDALTDQIGLKDTAHADALKAKDDEIASLNAVIAKHKADELAAKRFAELKAIKGFEIKADEEAALLAEIGVESEDKFTLRRVLAENAVLRKGIKPDETAGENADEHAGLAALHGGGAGKSGYAAVLFD